MLIKRWNQAYQWQSKELHQEEVQTKGILQKEIELEDTSKSDKDEYSGGTVSTKSQEPSDPVDTIIETHDLHDSSKLLFFLCNNSSNSNHKIKHDSCKEPSRTLLSNHWFISMNAKQSYHWL